MCLDYASPSSVLLQEVLSEALEQWFLRAIEGVDRPSASGPEEHSPADLPNPGRGCCFLLREGTERPKASYPPRPHILRTRTLRYAFGEAKTYNNNIAMIGSDSCSSKIQCVQAYHCKSLV